MDPRALFYELGKLNPAARQELSVAFRLAARAVAERLENAELTPDAQHRLEHQYRIYCVLAPGLSENGHRRQRGACGSWRFAQLRVTDCSHSRGRPVSDP